jgi:hypothetical protein
VLQIQVKNFTCLTQPTQAIPGAGSWQLRENFHSSHIACMRAQKWTQQNRLDPPSPGPQRRSEHACRMRESVNVLCRPNFFGKRWRRGSPVPKLLDWLVAWFGLFGLGCLVGLKFGFWLLAYKPQKHLKRYCWLWLLAYTIMQQCLDQSQKPKLKAHI